MADPRAGRRSSMKQFWIFESRGGICGRDIVGVLVLVDLANRRGTCACWNFRRSAFGVDLAERRSTCSCWNDKWSALDIDLSVCTFWREAASVAALVAAIAQKHLTGYADPERGDRIAKPYP